MQIKEILNSEAGKELSQILLKHYNRLKDIDNIKDFSKAQDQAVEIKASKKAVKILEDILYELMDISRVETSKPEEDKYYNLP